MNCERAVEHDHRLAAGRDEPLLAAQGGKAFAVELPDRLGLAVKLVELVLEHVVELPVAQDQLGRRVNAAIRVVAVELA